VTLLQYTILVQKIYLQCLYCSCHALIIQVIIKLQTPNVLPQSHIYTQSMENMMDACFPCH